MKSDEAAYADIRSTMAKNLKSSKKIICVTKPGPCTGNGKVHRDEITLYRRVLNDVAEDK